MVPKCWGGRQAPALSQGQGRPGVCRPGMEGWGRGQQGLDEKDGSPLHSGLCPQNPSARGSLLSRQKTGASNPRVS